MCFPKKERIINIVHALIPERQGMMSESTIRTVMDELKKEQVETREYSNDFQEASFGDGFPEPNPSTNVAKREAYIMDGADTYIHIAMFADLRRRSSSDAYKDCIRNLMHKYTPTRKIMLGVNMRSRGAVCSPHLFDTMRLAPREKMLIITTGVQMTRASTILLGATNDEEQYVLDMDLDSYGYRQRALTMQMDDIEAFSSN